MSWLKFNDSLNSIKGQISNFANNVLADEDEGSENTDTEYKKLQEVCQQQKLEIIKLRQINDDLNNKQNQSSDTTQPNGSWNWVTIEDKPSDPPTDSASDLKKQISALENEKSELLGQLDQLDADNQENLANIMKMKEKLQYELNDVNDNYVKIKRENKILTEKEQNLRRELESLKRKEGGSTSTENNEYIKKCKELTEANQKVTHELEELKKEFNVIASSNEDAKKNESSFESDKMKKLESESKLLHTKLAKANQTIAVFEKKSLEDIENCQKLTVILDTYEAQVSSLKQEIQEVSQVHADTVKKLTESEKLCNSLQEQHAKHNDETSKLNTEVSSVKEENSIRIKELEEAIEQLTIEIENMKKENNEISSKALIDDSSKNELEEIIQNQKDEIESHKLENDRLKKLNEDLTFKAAGRMDRDLEYELEDIQNEHEIQIKLLTEELEQLKKEEHKNLMDKTKLDEIEEEKLTIARHLKDVQEDIEELRQNHEINLQQLHTKYINVIKDNMRKFEECEQYSGFCYEDNKDDPQTRELSEYVGNIMKILLDLKFKCVSLENRIVNILEEKNAILLEKNHEIEKLIQNSDVLSQEIISKTKTAKEYENECQQLAKNNELLISELETFKNNPMLQTISESNEDSLILMESELERANKRIEDLENVIDDLEKSQIRKDSLEENSSSDLENAVKQLKNTETEINNKKHDYQELLNNFDQLQVDYESLRKQVEEGNENLIVCSQENHELKAALEKLKADYENTEYQLSELNVNSEITKDELEEYKNKFKLLLTENSSIKLKSDDNLKKYLDFVSKVDLLEANLVQKENNNRKYESQIEILTEKLQNAKMAETSLKLQYEQKNKELAAQSEERYNLELSLNKINLDLADFQNNFTELQMENDKLQLEKEVLKESILSKEEKIQHLEIVLKEVDEKVEQDVKSTEEINKTETTSEKERNYGYDNLKLILDQTVLDKANLKAELNKFSQIESQLKEATEKETTLHQQLQEITNSRNELINMVTVKHQENVTYHNEIQKLNQILITEAEKYKTLETQFKQLQTEISSNDIEAKNQEIEKLVDQNNFLKEKCEVMAKNLLEEQSKVQQLLSEKSVPSEKETTLQKNLDRLQAHLIELQEHYTEELLQAEQKISSLKTQVANVEEREKSSSNMHTSVSIRANQQVESLQSQLLAVITERDSLRKQISDAEDENTKQAAALANLQFVLEQFRKDKEKDVIRETDRIRRQINVEKDVQEELRKEINILKSQLEESNQGLLAASRLSDQLVACKKTVIGLKDEVSQLQCKLTKTEADLTNALSSTDGKVDKLLIKNLVIGFVTSNNNINRDQSQILKIISTVLDFNQQDHDKLKLNTPQQGWLASFLVPNTDKQNKMSEESLSKAFIQFLENESRPRIVPSLLNSAVPTPSSSSSKSTPRQSPIVLSEIVLPTFSDFAQNRNSSSILKDVLKDNS